MSDIKTILNDDNWQLCNFIPQTESLRFFKNTPQARQEHNFYDHDYLSGIPVETADIAIVQIRKHIDEVAPTSSIGVIAHTAFCGSTLLGRAMSEVYQWSSVREPNVLLDCAIFKMNNPQIATMENPHWRDLLDISIRLLAKETKRKVTVIKLSNAMNNLLADLENTNRLSVCVLHNSLREFLISNYKKKGFQGFVHQLLKFYSQIPKYQAVIQTVARELDDSRAVALTWLIQQDLLIEQEQGFSSQDFMSLPASEIFADIPKTAERIAGYFHQGSLPEIDPDNALFKEHSKYGNQDYSISEKNKEDDEIYSRYQASFVDAEQWLSAQQSHFKLVHFY